MKCERYGGEEADGDGERAHTCDCDDLPVVPLAGEMVEILKWTTFRWSFSRMDKNNYNYKYIIK